LLKNHVNAYACRHFLASSAKTGQNKDKGNSIQGTVMIDKIRTVFLLGLWGGFFILSLSTAQADDVFEVSGVYVDVTAENVTRAREKAMREGQGRAFDILLKRLTMKADRGLLPWVEPAKRAQYIRDFSINGERSSSVRYLATYTYHFKPDAIRNLLKARGISFAETISKPVLVLPLFEDGTRLSLWENPNPWRDVWSGQQTQNGLVPLALALGDLADISGVSAQQAQAGERDALMALAERYEVPSVIVAHLSVTARDGEGQPIAADLVINRFGSRYEGRTTLLGLMVQDNETPQNFLKRLSETVSDRVQESWKRDNLLQFGQMDVLPINLPITGLPEWLNVKQRLEKVAVVRRIELALLARDTVQVNLHFIGQLDQLIASLRQVDLDLTLNGESWTLINKGEGAGS